MAEYRISGVWKNSKGVITHYAFHDKSSNGVSRARKVSKFDAIILIENGNKAKTMTWDYKRVGMFVQENIVVVDNPKGNKFLRSTPDNHVGDNLENLIDMYWYPIS